MHEYSICIALLEQVEQITQQHHAERVKKIILKIGPLSGVEAELLQHAWPLAAADTVAEHAELIVETERVVIKCNQCGTESEVSPNCLLCTACGNFQTRLVSGDEMILASVELTRIEKP